MTTPATPFSGGFDGYRSSSGGDFKSLARSIRKPMPKRKSSVKGRKRENIVSRTGGVRRSLLGPDIGEKSGSIKSRNSRHGTMVDTGDKNRSKNMQEYLPDSIIACISSWEKQNENFNDEVLQLPKFDTFSTVCLFIDLAGFTSLTENLHNKLGSLGLNQRASIEALVEKLNQLYSKMLNTILKYGGDATRFAGDAIEVIWPIVPTAKDFVTRVSDKTIHNALRCALSLSQDVSVLFDQVDFDLSKLAKHYKDDFVVKGGQTIREKFEVRVGVGLGEVVILHIGGADDNVMKCRHEYICFGPAVSQAHDCERNAKPGQTVVHTGEFMRCRLSKRFRTEEIEGTEFSVLTHRVRVKRQRSKKDSIVPVKHKTKRMTKTISQSSGLHLMRDNMKIMNLNLSTNVERMLWRYVPIAAVPYIGESHHEEWLPEFRTVTTLFCNLGISPDEQFLPILDDFNRPNLLDDFQEMFLSIQQCVFRYEGTINKFLVDKGSVIMVVFGLPPFGHVDDAKRGVLCAKGITKILKNFHKKLEKPSNDKPTVGVTTGTVLCGVIGSYAYYSKHRVSTKGGKNWGTLKGNQLHVEKKKHARREYSIIGDSVNVASRLMVLARDLKPSLLIDEATVSSLRNELLFNGPEYHQVKGKANKIAVYELAPSGLRYRSKTELHRKHKGSHDFFSFSTEEEFEVPRGKPVDRPVLFGKSMRMGSLSFAFPRFRSTSSVLGKSQTYPSVLHDISSIKSSFCSDDHIDESSQVQFVFLEGQVGVGKSHLLYHAFEREEDDSMHLFTAFGNAYKTAKDGNLFGTIKYLLHNMINTAKKVADMNTEGIIVKAFREASKIINKSSKPVSSNFDATNKYRKETVSKLSTLSPKTKSILKDILGNCFQDSESYLNSSAHRLNSFFKGGLHIETIDCILGMAKRRNLIGIEAALVLSPVVEVVAALFVGLTNIINTSGASFVCVVEDTQNMDLLCWLIFLEICMFYSACKGLFVFSRTTLMLQEDEFQIYKSQETVSAYNCNSIFGKFSSTKLQNQYRGIFHYREKFEANKESVKFIRLNCSRVFTKAIVCAQFDVSSVDSTLIKYLEEKTNGNPLFVSDAVSFYLKLDYVQQVTDSEGVRGLEVTNLTGIYNAGPPSSVEGVTGAMLDRLSPIQQLILKTCATCAFIERDIVVQKVKQQKPELLNGTVIPNVFSKSLALDRFPIQEYKVLAEGDFTELVDMGIIQKPVSSGRNQGSDRNQKVPQKKRRATVLNSFRNRVFATSQKEEKSDEFCFGIPWMLDSVLHRMLSSQREKIEKGNYDIEEDDSKNKHKEIQNARDVISSEKFELYKKSFSGKSFSERSGY